MPGAARPLQLPLATIAMVAAVAIGFAAGVMTGLVPLAPTPPQLVAAGASYGPRTLADEPWRVLTAAVVHAGWAHLIVNVATMTVMGVALERRAGRLATVAVLVGASAVGTAAGTAGAPYAVIAGASSGALGLAAALVAVMAIRAVEAGPRRIEIVLLGAALTVIVAHVAMARGRDDIDQVGHVAGVIAGIVMGALVARRATGVAAGIAAVAVVIVVVVARPAPYEPRRATAQLVAIEARFDELVAATDEKDLARRADLAAALVRDVVTPLETLASDPRLDDARMNDRLRARVARLRAYARARADVVRRFADAVKRDDVAPLADIERASRAADAVLDGPLP